MQLQWRQLLLEYVGFLSAFWMLGAVGFRFGVVRSTAGAAFEAASAKAASIGAVGALFGAVSMVVGLLERAEQKHTTLEQAWAAGGNALVLQAVLLRSEERRVGKECRSRWSRYH